MFFVSVASKELRIYVSGLESTLAGTSISVDSKGTYVAKIVQNGLLFVVRMRFQFPCAKPRVGVG